MNNSYKKLLHLIDNSISLSDLEKIGFIEYIYHNPSKISYYIEILQGEKEKITKIKTDFVYKYNVLNSSLITKLNT